MITTFDDKLSYIDGRGLQLLQYTKFVTSQKFKTSKVMKNNNYLYFFHIFIPNTGLLV